MLKPFALAALLLGLIGCHPPRAVTYRRIPTTSYVDTTTSLPNYRTFALAPYAVIIGTSDRATRDDQVHLFKVKDVLTQRGYVWTPFLDSADFVVAARLDSWDGLDDPIKKREAIPFYPRLTVNPISVFDFATSDSTPVWQRPAQGQTVDHSYVGYSFPRSRLLFYDRNKRSPILCLDGGGSYDTPSLLVSVQYVLMNFVDDIPNHDTSFMKAHLGRGMIGFDFNIFTIDGLNYWPNVTFVVAGSGASEGDLQANDVIISANGVSLKNKSRLETLDILKNKPGTAFTFKVWRNQLGVRDLSIISLARPPGM